MIVPTNITENGDDQLCQPKFIFLGGGDKGSEACRCKEHRGMHLPQWGVPQFLLKFYMQI